MYRLYVDHLVAVIREVHRVLRPDGTLWLNLGDCYATGAGKANHAGGAAAGRREQTAISVTSAEPHAAAGAEAEGSDRHPVARRLRTAGRRLVAAP